MIYVRALRTHSVNGYDTATMTMGGGGTAPVCLYGPTGKIKIHSFLIPVHSSTFDDFAEKVKAMAGTEVKKVRILAKPIVNMMFKHRPMNKGIYVESDGITMIFKQVNPEADNQLCTVYCNDADTYEKVFFPKLKGL